MTVESEVRITVQQTEQTHNILTLSTWSDLTHTLTASSLPGIVNRETVLDFVLIQMESYNKNQNQTPPDDFLMTKSNPDFV